MHVWNDLESPRMSHGNILGGPGHQEGPYRAPRGPQEGPKRAPNRTHLTCFLGLPGERPSTCVMGPCRGPLGTLLAPPWGPSGGLPPCLGLARRPLNGRKSAPRGPQTACA
eukprot:5365970-Pyramimonas_sp.AAC.1